ncbi:MAG: iron dicitrate transport regulator FecR [Alphaproteobacteria bacterium HGW-Alphaproteobacteria-16]|nr:MAG: iron dicitrate transport regulator FecR [Alphaproteobacteria bacterium HGW-Alphaproteobacteria-16]
MWAEAASASDAVRRQLNENGDVMAAIASSIAATPPSACVTIARGSSDHAASFLKFLLETQAGILTASLPPSVASIYSTAPRLRDGLCVAISQSGRSTDLLTAVEAVAAQGARTVAMVNDADSPLAALAQFAVPLHAGTERSVAATKSYIASLFACLHLVSELIPGRVPASWLHDLGDQLDMAWQCDWSALTDGLVDARGLYVIGRGPGYAAAAEAALKFKETCALHAEAYSAAEVRHGPMALLDPEMPVLIFRQEDEAAGSIDELAAFAVEQGCRVFVAGSAPAGAIRLDTINAPSIVQPLLQIQSFYKAVNALALRRGRDPDRPPLLRKVTVTV